MHSGGSEAPGVGHGSIRTLCSSAESSFEAGTPCSMQQGLSDTTRAAEGAAASSDAPICPALPRLSYHQLHFHLAGGVLDVLMALQ